ncbi:hypothetical protein FA95DRAFT_1562266 [Auriscalpium vulgare]|uniref:Uncharacterized protein n=1 Tax=Auriscalpium vulgare TaxID=40419 RepID=A0ACB8RJN4_9AGAM|nr:hypothetical protein FA95DRAFT_1562266 [Auriscalpium vulgare]
MFSLHPNRDLLNPKFEGYKLEPISQEAAVAHHPIQYRPSQATVSGRAPLSFQEAQSRIRHNHLVIDTNANRAAYIDGELRVVLVHVDDASLQPTFTVIHELPAPIQTSSSDSFQREYPSLAFLDAHTLFVSDGCGSLYVLTLQAAGPAHTQATYQLPTSGDASSESSLPFRVHNAVSLSDGTSAVLLSSKHIESNPETPSSPPHQGHHRPPSPHFDVFAARFATAEAQPDNSILPLDIIWRRRGTDVPLYVAHDSSQKTFLLVGHSAYEPVDAPMNSPYEPSADEMMPVPRGDEATSTQAVPARPPPYAWTQDSEELTIAFPLPSTTTKNAINVLFSPQTLTVIVRGEAAELPRYSAVRLWDGISPSSSFWTWDAQGSSTYGLLTLHLEKQHAGTRWPHIFTAGAGEEVSETLDPSQLYHIREALEKYTTSLQEGRDTSGLGLGSGVPSLAEGELDDEVDSTVGSTVCLTWVTEDGSSPTWTRGDTDVPFNVLSTPLPGICSGEVSLVVKHTIDGALFTLVSGGAGTWTHSSTYSALAFVLASKRDTRFAYHVDSNSVLAFEGGSADFGGNLYIYRNAASKATSAKQSILKIGGGAAGSVLGVGAVHIGGQAVVLCLCEGELVVIRDIL